MPFLQEVTAYHSDLYLPSEFNLMALTILQAIFSFSLWKQAGAAAHLRAHRASLPRVAPLPTGHRAGLPRAAPHCLEEPSGPATSNQKSRATPAA